MKRLNRALSLVTSLAPAALLSVAAVLPAAADENAELVINGDIEIVTRAPAPAPR